MHCTFKKIDFDIKWWDGEPLANFALDTETPLIVKGETPEYVIGSIYAAGKQAFLLKRQDVERFFRTNYNSIMWMHNAPFDLAVCQKLLTGNQHLYKTRSILTEMVERNQVYDTGILYQLIEIARTGRCPQRWSLALLVDIFHHEHLDKGEERVTYAQYFKDGVVDYDNMSEKHLTYSAKDAVVTKAVAIELVKLLPELDVYNQTLSHNLQLKAAIVFYEMSNTPVHLDKKELRGLQAKTQVKIDGLIKVMMTYGYNEYAASGKKRRYSYIIKQLEKEYGVTIRYEGNDDAQKKKINKVKQHPQNLDMFSSDVDEFILSKSMKEEDLFEIKEHPFVEAFIAYAHLKILMNTFIKPCEDKDVLFARWNTLVATGRGSCTKPNLQNLPRKGGFRECIIPSKGNVFVGADYSFIELCTFSQWLFWVFGSSKMRDAINAGIDPHKFTASQVLNIPVEEVTAEQRQYAKAINFGIGGGLSAKTLVGYAKNNYGIDLTLEEANKWRNKVLTAYPEIQDYLNFTIPTCVLPSGRVRGECCYTVAHNTPFQGLAADGAKTALWNLYTQKAKIVLFIHDEIIVECPVDKIGVTEKMVSGTMEKSMNEVIPNVKVRAEPFAMDCWLKSAEEERDDAGNLLVCTKVM